MDISTRQYFPMDDLSIYYQFRHGIIGAFRAAYYHLQNLANANHGVFDVHVSWFAGKFGMSSSSGKKWLDWMVKKHLVVIEQERYLEKRKVERTLRVRLAHQMDEMVSPAEVALFSQRNFADRTNAFETAWMLSPWKRSGKTLEKDGESMRPGRTHSANQQNVNLPIFHDNKSKKPQKMYASSQDASDASSQDQCYDQYKEEINTGQKKNIKREMRRDASQSLSAIASGTFSDGSNFEPGTQRPEVLEDGRTGIETPITISAIENSQEHAEPKGLGEQTARPPAPARAHEDLPNEEAKPSISESVSNAIAEARKSILDRERATPARFLPKATPKRTGYRANAIGGVVIPIRPDMHSITNSLIISPGRGNICVQPQFYNEPEVQPMVDDGKKSKADEKRARWESKKETALEGLKTAAVDAQTGGAARAHQRLVQEAVAAKKRRQAAERAASMAAKQAKLHVDAVDAVRANERFLKPSATGPLQIHAYFVALKREHGFTVLKNSPNEAELGQWKRWLDLCKTAAVDPQIILDFVVSRWKLTLEKKFFFCRGMQPTVGLVVKQDNTEQFVAEMKLMGVAPSHVNVSSCESKKDKYAELKAMWGK